MTDMAAQKEAFMKQIRNEYALNNAQELMNVSMSPAMLLLFLMIKFLNMTLENERKVLFKMRNETLDIVIEFGRGA